MSEDFKAILISRDAEKRQSVAVTRLTEADLMDGDVTVSIEATTINYKDGLAITGKANMAGLLTSQPTFSITFASPTIDLKTLFARMPPQWIHPQLPGIVEQRQLGGTVEIVSATLTGATAPSPTEPVEKSATSGSFVRLGYACNPPRLRSRVR